MSVRLLVLLLLCTAEQLDRSVVNETNLDGQFEFNEERGVGTRDNFLERLRNQTGLLITPAQRRVEVLAF